jgi:hypothetical protein
VTAVGAAACEQSAPLYCQKLFECYPQDGADLYGTLESCKIADAADCRHLATLPDVSPKSIEAWASCNRALGARSCEQWRFGAPLAECHFPAGTRQMGNACVGSTQCASNHCQVPLDPSTGNPAECGVCAPPPGVGQACNWANNCDFGLRCVETPDVQGGEGCIQPAAEGAACREDDNGPCQGSLVCVQGRCSKPLAAGGACIATFQCDGALRCVNGTCGPALSEGAACASSDRVCGLGLVCVNGACSKPLPEGAPCTGDEQCQGFCAGDPNATGTITNGKCLGGGSEPDARVGEACAPDASSTGMGPRCVYNAFCDRTTSRCVLRKPNGQSCADDTHCLGWLRCNAGKCDDAPVPMCGM